MFNVKINGVSVPIEGVTREEFDLLPDEVKLKVTKAAKNQAELMSKGQGSTPSQLFTQERVPIQGGYMGMGIPLGTMTVNKPTKITESWRSKIKNAVDSITNINDLDDYINDPDIAKDPVLMNYIKGRSIELGAPTGQGLAMDLLFTREGTAEALKGSPGRAALEFGGNLIAAGIPGVGPIAKVVSSPVGQRILGSGIRQLTSRFGGKEAISPTSSEAFILSEQAQDLGSYTQRQDAFIKQKQAAIDSIDSTIKQINSRQDLDQKTKEEALLSLNKAKSEANKAKTFTQSIFGIDAALMLNRIAGLAGQLAIGVAGDPNAFRALVGATAKGLIKGGKSAAGVLSSLKEPVAEAAIPEKVPGLAEQLAPSLENIEDIKIGIPGQTEKVRVGNEIIARTKEFTQKEIDQILPKLIKEREFAGLSAPVVKSTGQGKFYIEFPESKVQLPVGKLQGETVRPEYKYESPVTKTGREQAVEFERQAIETQQQNLIDYPQGLERVPAIDSATGKEIPGAFNFIDPKTGKVVTETATLPAETFPKTGSIGDVTVPASKIEETIPKTVERPSFLAEQTARVKKMLSDQKARKEARKLAEKSVEEKAKRDAILVRDPVSKKINKAFGFNKDDAEFLIKNYDEEKTIDTIISERPTAGTFSRAKGSIIGNVTEALTSLKGVDGADLLRNDKFDTLRYLESNIPIDVAEATKGSRFGSLFEKLSGATDIEASKIIDNAFQKLPDTVLMEEFKSNLIKIAKGQNVTADMIRDVEQNLNNINRKIYEKGYSAAEISNFTNDLMDLKKILTSERRKIAKETLNSRTKDLAETERNLGNKYEELENIATEELDSEIALRNQMFTGKTKDIPKTQVAKVADNVSLFLEELLNRHARQGLGATSKDIQDQLDAFFSIAKKAGISDIEQKYNALLMDRYFGGSAGVPSGATLSRENVFLKKRTALPKTMAETATDAAIANPWLSYRVRIGAKIIKHLGITDELKVAQVRKLMNQRKDGDFLAGFILASSTRSLANSLNRGDIAELIDQYQDDSRIRNKLKAVESFFGVNTP